MLSRIQVVQTRARISLTLVKIILGLDRSLIQTRVAKKKMTSQIMVLSSQFNMPLSRKIMEMEIILSLVLHRVSILILRSPSAPNFNPNLAKPQKVHSKCIGIPFKVKPINKRLINYPTRKSRRRSRSRYTRQTALFCNNSTSLSTK